MTEKVRLRASNASAGVGIVFACLGLLWWPFDLIALLCLYFSIVLGAIL